MEQQIEALDAAVMAAGLSMVYNADDWDRFAAIPRPIKESHSEQLPPFLN